MTPAGDAPDPVAPEISVIIPTAGRPQALRRVLTGLAQQTLPAGRFEVVVTDDGSDPRAEAGLEGFHVPFRMKLAWQPRSGPAAARNRAIAAATGRFLLILNDDAGPPVDLLERHLEAQLRSPESRAYLGGFAFAPDCRTPLSIATDRLKLLFPFEDLRRDRPNPGRFFWTCNISVRRDAVLAAGGFDESYTRPLCEDVDLGYRLDKRGTDVFHLAGAACLHHHRIDTAWFVRRQIDLGMGIVRLWRKYGDVELFPWARKAPDEQTLAAAFEMEVRARGRGFEETARRIAQVDERAPSDDATGATLEEQVNTIVPWLRRINEDTFLLGMLAGLRGKDMEWVGTWLAALAPLTTVVVPSGGSPKDYKSIRRLRATAGSPLEVVVLSSPGSATGTSHPEGAGGTGDEGNPLADVTWLARTEPHTSRPLGARIAEIARGEYLCVFRHPWSGTPGWLAAALAKLQAAQPVCNTHFTLVRRQAPEPARAPVSAETS